MAPAAAEERRDDAWVDDGLAVVDAVHGVDKDGRGEDPFLEQVADLFRMSFEEADGVAGFEILRQHEDADVRVLLANPFGGPQPLVRMRRRHLDVDDGNVGLLMTEPPA